MARLNPVTVSKQFLPAQQNGIEQTSFCTMFMYRRWMVEGRKETFEIIN